MVEKKCKFVNQTLDYSNELNTHTKKKQKKKKKKKKKKKNHNLAS